MKENLILESFESQNVTKDKLIRNAFIFDIISFLPFILFVIIKQKIMYIISAVLCFLISIYLIVMIFLKLKKIKKKRLENEYNEEEEKKEKMEEKDLDEKNELIKEKENKKQSEILEEKLEKISKRQFNLLKNNELQLDVRNENLDLIEKAGKLKSLSDEEIKKEKKNVQILEDMNMMGTIMKEQILEEKKTNPEKFFSTEEIIEQKKNDDDLFSLGIFSKALESQGIVTAIEKEVKENDDKKKMAQTSLQFLINGMSEKPKYNLHFDLGEDKNKQLLNDENERKNFHDKLRKKLSEEYKIKEEDIIITFPRKGSYQVTIIFKSSDFKLNENDLIKKFSNEKNELGKLKQIETGVILGGCKLNRSMLDYRGNNKDGGWAGKGEKRGGEEYIPPIGFVGYGLKVYDVYENNIWLGMDNSQGEWCVAYHGVARGQDPQKVANITGLISKSGFIPSTGGKATNDPDLRHPGKTCGLGVYCSPDISYAEGYAGITELNGERYKCVLMLRVNPGKIRQSTLWPKEYILDANPNEIRPYRILLKKVN